MWSSLDSCLSLILAEPSRSFPTLDILQIQYPWLVLQATRALCIRAVSCNYRRAQHEIPILAAVTILGRFSLLSAFRPTLDDRIHFRPHNPPRLADGIHLYLNRHLVLLGSGNSGFAKAVISSCQQAVSPLSNLSYDNDLPLLASGNPLTRPVHCTRI